MVADPELDICCAAVDQLHAGLSSLEYSGPFYRYFGQSKMGGTATS